MRIMHELRNASWRKASYSTSSQGCVEVALTSAAVGVRGTKDRSGGTLVFDRSRWASFLRSIKGD